jgi:hypothetical protein
MCRALSSIPRTITISLKKKKKVYPDSVVRPWKERIERSKVLPVEVVGACQGQFWATVTDCDPSTY